MRRGIAVLVLILIFGGVVMAADSNPGQSAEDLKKQMEILQQQLALTNAQIALDTARQTQEAQVTKALTEALKNQANLQSEQAKLPLAELAGVKAALSGMQLPAGKSGTFQITAGGAGTSLLRSKLPMLKLLDDVAGELHRQLPNGAVIVTEPQLEQAYQADITLKRIHDQTEKLKKATVEAKPKVSVAQPMVIPQVAAAAYSLGFVLDTVNSMAKLFRVDRKVDIYSADAEAGQILGYMLEGKNTKFVANPAMVRAEVLTGVDSLLSKLNDLQIESQQADDLLSQLKKIEEDEAKTKPSSSQLPAASIVSGLKAQIEAARTLIDGLHPSKKPEAFWAQVKGQLISETLRDQKRLLIEAKAQALQITESRWYASDRLMIGGEIQVAYRILSKDGKVEKTGVILKTSDMEEVSFKKMFAISFP